MKNTTYNSVDFYISAFPEQTREALEKIRFAISKAAPKAEEVISYKMPAFRLNGMLCYFAGYKNHIGFYPTSSGIEAFKEKLKDFKCSKGAVQFPLNKELPLKLITEIVKFRLAQNLEKAKGK